MPRIILEDVKLNKNRRRPLKKEEPIEVVEKKEKVFHPKIKKQKKIKKTEEFINNAEIHKKVNKSFRTKETKVQKPKRIYPRKESKTFSKFFSIILILCVIGGVVYWGGNIFQKANVILTTKIQQINYKDKLFTAKRGPNNNAVDFEIMVISDKKMVNVLLSDPQELSKKAEGSITLYNEFSTKAEKIVAGTYISDSEGKTYKTNSTVSVPGYKTISKKTVPGQESVKITSFLAGEAYNETSDYFRINAFKGTAKYNKIYGKLKDSLVGGVSGLAYVLDSKNREKVEEVADTTFKADMLRQVRALIPPGYILYPNATTFSYKIGDNIYSKSQEFDVEIEGTLSAVLLEKNSLIDNIIDTSLPEIKGEELKEIKILDLSKLVFDFTDSGQSITKETISVPFSLTGDVDVLWSPDLEILKARLVGIPKDNVSSIFKTDPGITSAIVKIFPPWQKNIPDNIFKINIIAK